MRGVRFRIVIVALMSAAFIGGNAATPQPAHAVVTTLERELASYHNSARASRGLPRLVLDSTLSDKARAHTRGMIKVGRLFHTSSLSRSYGTGEGTWRYLGENVGYGGSMRALHDAFMRSYSHRANMLSPRYKRVGLGAVKSGSRYWVTVAFIG